MEQIERTLGLFVAFKPDLLLVSAGFDAYKDDPITEMTLLSGRFRNLRPMAARNRPPRGRNSGRRL